MNLSVLAALAKSEAYASSASAKKSSKSSKK